MGEKYILRDRVPIACEDTLEWGSWFQNADRKVMATDLGDGGRISTVFLGLDHSFGGGPPQLFETLVFDGPLSDEMDRYSTWEEAETEARVVHSTPRLLQ